MGWFKRLRAQPWLIVGLPVGGLLLAIAIAGLVGIAINRSVSEVTERALRYDVELEDRGDDLRVAVLNLRHYHRNITFAPASRGGREEFERAYRDVHREIDGLERLGITDPSLPRPARLRQMVNGYYAGFRPAIELRETDPQEFTRASDEGLVRLDALEAAAADVDQLGEIRAAAALESVDRASRTATYVLFGVLGGLVLVGAALAYSVVRTVGEVRRLYARQQATSEQLARALRAKTDFIADASHELRTPLTILRGNAEVGLALDRGGVHGEILAEILKASGRMQRLVEDLLFLARSDSASLPLQPEPLPVARLVGDLAEPAEVLARQQDIRLAIALQGAGRVRADKTRIEQSVLILVDNAVKYSAPGARIALTSTTEGGELCIAVADRGPGIPAAELPLIFERFYHVDKARARKQGGAGLGLAIARTIVEAHGGRLEARSQVGRGTTMTIRLPLIATAHPTNSPRRQRAATGPPVAPPGPHL